MQRCFVRGHAAGDAPAIAVGDSDVRRPVIMRGVAGVMAGLTMLLAPRSFNPDFLAPVVRGIILPRCRHGKFMGISELSP